MALTSASDTGAVLKANTRFATEFYSILKKSRPNSNLIFSPFSLSACVGMVKAGAGGVTAEEIRKSMHYPEDRILFNGFKGLMEGLRVSFLIFANDLE
jgi:serpin B